MVSVNFLEYLRVERNYAAYTLESYRCDLQQFARFLYPRIADASLPVKSWSSALPFVNL